MMAKHDMYSVYPCGCAFDLTIKGLKPLKPWRIVMTTNERVAVEMNDKRCRHPRGFHHDHLEGGQLATLVGFAKRLWLLQSYVRCSLKSSLRGCSPCQPWLTVPKNVPQRN